MILDPFDQPIDEPKDGYNFYQYHARMANEHTFGILVRFRCSDEV